jgi:hypothetical protein
MKNNIAVIFLILTTLICASCENPSNANENPSNSNNDNSTTEVKTGKVTFMNELSYSVIVHTDAFSGPVLAELSSGQTKRVEVRTSDNYGVGSTFSVEYLYRITDGFDAGSGEVLASGIDPNIQINFVVEADKSYTKQIPQPSALEFQSAFIKILNTSSMQFELAYQGTSFKQTGNGNLSVPTGKTGVYKLEGIPAAGKLYHDYRVVSTFQNTTIPDFTAMNGYIYSFSYDGSAVTKTGEQSITFKQGAEK